jgi:hypothetical protein
MTARQNRIFGHMSLLKRLDSPLCACLVANAEGINHEFHSYRLSHLIAGLSIPGAFVRGGGPHEDGYNHN